MSAMKSSRIVDALTDGCDCAATRGATATEIAVMAAATRQMTRALRSIVFFSDCFLCECVRVCVCVFARVFAD